MSYTKNQGLESLKRTLLLMSYDNKKTLTENVEEILSEQSNVDLASLELRKAVRGPGTNPTILRQAIDKLKSKAEYDELNKNIRENPGYFLVGGGVNNLQDILNQELGYDNLSTAEHIQKKLSSIGVNMEFNTFNSKDYMGNINKVLYTDSITIGGAPRGGQAGDGQAGGGKAGGGKAGGGQASSRSTICNKALGANEGPKIEEFTLTFPGDTGYKYVSKNGKWFALNIRTQKRFGLTDLINGGCTKYQLSVDKLNKQFPNTSQKQDQTNTNQTTTLGTEPEATNPSSTVTNNDGGTTKIDSRNVYDRVSTPQFRTQENPKLDLSSPSQITKEFCRNLYSSIERNDQERGGRTANSKQLADVEKCLQQYNIFQIDAAKIRRRYGYTMSGGDKGIR